MERNKKKEKRKHRFGFLEKGANCTQVFISKLSTTCALKMGWKRVLTLTFTMILKLENIVQDFVKCRDTNFQTCGTSLDLHIHTTLMCIWMFMGNGNGTPNLRWYIIYECGFRVYQFHRSQNHALVRNQMVRPHEPCSSDMFKETSGQVIPKVSVMSNPTCYKDHKILQWQLSTCQRNSTSRMGRILRPQYVKDNACI